MHVPPFWHELEAHASPVPGAGALLQNLHDFLQYCVESARCDAQNPVLSTVWHGSARLAASFFPPLTKYWTRPGLSSRHGVQNAQDFLQYRCASAWCDEQKPVATITAQGSAMLPASFLPPRIKY